jgi:hypothetical protein
MGLSLAPLVPLLLGARMKIGQIVERAARHFSLCVYWHVHFLIWVSTSGFLPKEGNSSDFRRDLTRVA